MSGDSKSRYKCDICDKEYKEQRSVDRHKLNIHSNAYQVFKCPESNCKFQSKGDKGGLTRHVANVHRENAIGIFGCKICLRTFKAKRNLSLHAKSCKKEPPKSCHICDKVFTKGYLQTHIRNQHTGEREERLQKCDDCDFQTGDMYALKKHIKSIHSEDRPLKCQFENCSYAGKSSINLRQHIKWSHSSEKRYKCDVCDYATKERPKLNLHIRAKHSDEERDRLSCNICSKLFKTTCGLRLHVKSVHQNSYIFNCDKCSYKTNVKPRFEGHMNARHLFIKPYQCKLCDFRTAQILSLWRHEKTLHELGRDSKMYQCDICDFKTAHRSSLKRHIQLKHKTRKMR